MKGPTLFQGEIIKKLRKYVDKFKKSSSPEPLGQFSIKPGTNHFWVKGIQDCSNEGPHSFPRRDNNEIAKIH